MSLLASGGPAAAAHLKVGERIEVIDVYLIGPSDPSEVWRTLPAGTMRVTGFDPGAYLQSTSS